MPERVSPGLHRVGAEQRRGGRLAAPPPAPRVAGARDRASAAAASASDGIWIVLPTTTWASSGRPLAAARVRVVKLLAAAIDHSVSPGWTVWGTAAVAGVAVAAAEAAGGHHSSIIIYVRNA